MTPQKMRSILDGQTSVAKKVYEVVPIQEAWPARKIYATLNEITRSTMDMRIFRGCLNALRESGLIRETTSEVYKKVEVKQKVEMEMLKLPTKTVPEIKAASPKATTADPIGLLSGLSSRLRGLADDIDGAAVAIADGMAESEANLNKLRQLQSILKSLS